jgi:hypothetical protein
MDKEKAKKANAVDIALIAEFYGYELVDEGAVYRAKNEDGLFFVKKTNQFAHLKLNQEGGPIDFVMLKNQTSTENAITQLLTFQADNRLKLPERAPGHKTVYWYLVQTCGIDADIVTSLLAQNKLFQDNESNCIFVAYDEKGKEMNASKCSARINDANWEVLRGSDETYPFHLLGAGHKLYVFQTPIDAMSHATISLLRGDNWCEDHRIVTKGFADKTVQWFLDHHVIREINFAYNRTFTVGKLPSEKVIQFPHATGLEVSENFALKYNQMGYKAQVITPEDWDFNCDLLLLKKQRTLYEQHLAEKYKIFVEAESLSKELSIN